MPRLAVIADIHGNHIALRAIIDDILATGISDFYCIGDVVNGAYPDEAMRELDRLPGLRCIVGNAELYLLTPYMSDPPEDQVRLVRNVEALNAWWREILPADRLEQVARWPEHLLEHGILFVHDDPVSRLRKHTWHRSGVAPEFQEMLYHSRGIGPENTDEEVSSFLQIAGELDARVIVAGHVHHPRDHRENGVAIVTAPSVGMPIDGDWRGGWVELSVGEGDPSVVFHRVAYDRDRWYGLLERRRTFPSIETDEKLERYRSIFERGRMPHQKD